jgi:hypothetical protein
MRLFNIYQAEPEPPDCSPAGTETGTKRHICQLPWGHCRNSQGCEHGENVKLTPGRETAQQIESIRDQHDRCQRAAKQSDRDWV